MIEIMQSIKPKWCELVISGGKTIEVRKTRPNCGAKMDEKGNEE